MKSRPGNSRGVGYDPKKYGFLRGALGKMALCVFSLVTFLSPLPFACADSGQSAEAQGGPSKSFLVSLEYGWPAHFLSHQKYPNFQAVTLLLSREWEYASLIIPKKHGFVESLLAEFRLSKIWGKNIPLMLDNVSPESMEKAQREGRWPTADWDHYLAGMTGFYRLYYPLSGKLRPYAEVGVGLALLDKPLVDNGTIWNFSMMAGLGIEREICKIPFYVVFRAEHYSNGAQLWNKFGFRKGNIGVETLAVGLGVRFR